MAIVRSFGSATLLKPGAYSTTVQDNTAGANLGNNDTIMIIGEAIAGSDGVTEGGSRVFRSSNINQLAEYYEGGDIVDAALAAARPSVTPGVGGAGNIVVFKTNISGIPTSSITLEADDTYTTVPTISITPIGANVSQDFVFGDDFLEVAPTFETAEIKVNAENNDAIEGTTLTITPPGGTAVVFTFAPTGNIVTTGLADAEAIAAAAVAIIDADANITAVVNANDATVIDISFPLAGAAEIAIVVASGLATDALEIDSIVEGADRATGQALADAINANNILRPLFIASAVSQVVTLTAKAGEAANGIGVALDDVTGTEVITSGNLTGGNC